MCLLVTDTNYATLMVDVYLIRLTPDIAYRSNVPIPTFLEMNLSYLMTTVNKHVNYVIGCQCAVYTDIYINVAILLEMNLLIFRLNIETVR